jgi:hypothetical protein
MNKDGEINNGGLLIVAGHAIYQNGTWYGGFHGEELIYEQHVRDGLSIFRSERYEALVFSGGHTRPKLQEVQNGFVTNTEAEGLLEFAFNHGLCAGREKDIYVESYARDSFENILFSIMCFYHHNESWPSRVGIVSWKFKALRFYLIACGLKLGDGKFIFFGSGDLYLQKTMEIAAAETAMSDSAIVWLKEGPEIMDPLHRNINEFQKKRLERMPDKYGNNEDYIKAVKTAYDRNFNLVSGKQGIVGKVIDDIENAIPGSSWRDYVWPW